MGVAQEMRVARLAKERVRARAKRACMACVRRVRARAIDMDLDI